MLQNQQVILKVLIHEIKTGQRNLVKTYNHQTIPIQEVQFRTLLAAFTHQSLTREAPSLFMTSNWWQSFFSMHRELRRPYWLFSACFFILSWWYMDVSFLWVIILAKVNIWHYRDFLINIVCTSPVIPRIVFVPEATWPYRALYVIIQGKLN